MALHDKAVQPEQHGAAVLRGLEAAHLFFERLFDGKCAERRQEGGLEDILHRIHYKLNRSLDRFEDRISGKCIRHDDIGLSHNNVPAFDKALIIYAFHFPEHRVGSLDQRISLFLFYAEVYELDGR